MSIWNAVIHSANQETGSGPYNEVALSTVAALTGYASYTLGITAVHEAPEGEPAVLFASGAVQSSRVARRTYTLRSEPFDFETSRHIATNDLIVLMQKAYLWLELNTAIQDPSTNVGYTEQYHQTDYVVPVTIDGFNVDHRDDSGTKIVTINLKHRFFNT